MAKLTTKATKPYDATFKHLIEERPRDALAFIGITDVETVEVVDAEISTIAAAVDKALKVTTRGASFVVHLEFQSSHDADLVERLFWYNVVLYRRHRVPVETVLILLTPAADSPGIVDYWQLNLPSGAACLSFRFRTVRLWQVPVQAILASGLGVLPLAPLAADGDENIAEVVAQMQRRMTTEATPAEIDTLWAATYLLMGLRLDAEAARRLILGGQHMRESSTYQAVLEEGRVEGRAEGRTQGALVEARRLLLQLGARYLGKPSSVVTKAVKQLSQLAQVEDMLLRVPEASSWQALLARPPAAKNGHKKTS